MRYTFAPGEHDEYVCKHVLAGHVITGPVEHVHEPDGTTHVDFPLDESVVLAALGTYDRADYEQAGQEAVLTRDEIVKLKELANAPNKVVK